MDLSPGFFIFLDFMPDDLAHALTGLHSLDIYAQIGEKYRVLYDPEDDRMADLEQEDRDEIFRLMRLSILPTDIVGFVRGAMEYNTDLLRYFMGFMPSPKTMVAIAEAAGMCPVPTHIPKRQRILSVMSIIRRSTWLTLDTRQVGAQLPVSTRDFIENEDVDCQVYLSNDPHNIVLVQGVFGTCSNKVTICTTSEYFYPQDMNGVDTNKLLYTLHGRGTIYVDYKTLAGLLLSTCRYFLVVPTDTVYERTVSGTLHDGPFIPGEYGVTSGQPGTDKRLSSLVALSCK